MSLAVVGAVAVVMGVRWRRTGKFMPAGIVMGLSLLMVAFYVWNFLYVKPPPHKLEARRV